MTKQKNPSKAKAAKQPKPEKKFDDVDNVPLRTALQKSGGYTQLGEALGVSRQMVHRWDALPERFAVRIEELYGIPRAETAPSMFKGMVPAK